MKTKLNKDYNGVIHQCFSPNESFLEVTSNTEFEVSNYSVVEFDQDVTMYFNSSSSTTYTDWPAHCPIQLTNKINTITISKTCNMMFMWDNDELEFSDMDTSDFLVDDSGAYLIDSDGRYLTSG